MKKTDLAMIVFIASVSILVAYFIGNSIFGNVTNKGQQVQTIEAINTVVQEPDKTVFNTNAINPSVEVQITGSETATDPTTSGTQ